MVHCTLSVYLAVCGPGCSGAESDMGLQGPALESGLCTLTQFTFATDPPSQQGPFDLSTVAICVLSTSWGCGSQHFTEQMRQLLLRSFSKAPGDLQGAAGKCTLLSKCLSRGEHSGKPAVIRKSRWKKPSYTNICSK